MDMDFIGNGIGIGMMIFFFFIKANNGRISFNFFNIFFLLIACVSCTWLTKIRFSTTMARMSNDFVLLLVVKVDIVRECVVLCVFKFGYIG